MGGHVLTWLEKSGPEGGGDYLGGALFSQTTKIPRTICVKKLWVCQKAGFHRMARYYQEHKVAKKNQHIFRQIFQHSSSTYCIPMCVFVHTLCLCVILPNHAHNQIKHHQICGSICIFCSSHFLNVATEMWCLSADLPGRHPRFHAVAFKEFHPSTVQHATVWQGSHHLFEF